MRFLLVKFNLNLNIKVKMILYINTNFVAKNKIIIFHFIQLIKTV